MLNGHKLILLFMMKNNFKCQVNQCVLYSEKYCPTDSFLLHFKIMSTLGVASWFAFVYTGSLFPLPPPFQFIKFSHDNP